MNRGLGKHIVLFLLALFLLAACKKGAPRGVIPQGKMEKVLYDYYLTKAMVDDLRYEEKYKQAFYMNYVFDKHKITQAQFDSSLVWYTRNTKIFAEIHQHVSERMKQQRDGVNQLIAMRDKRSRSSQPGDTVDVWSDKRLHILTGSALTNKVQFTITPDTNYKERDALLWHVAMNFLTPEEDSLQYAVMNMQIRYNNDTLLQDTRVVYNSGEYDLRLQLDSLEIKEVHGFVYYANASQDPGRKLLLDHISLIRYHAPDSLPSLSADTLITDSIAVVAEPTTLLPKDSAVMLVDTVAVVDTMNISAPSRRNSPADMRRRTRKETTE